MDNTQPSSKIESIDSSVKSEKDYGLEQIVELEEDFDTIGEKKTSNSADFTWHYDRYGNPINRYSRD